MSEAVVRACPGGFWPCRNGRSVRLAIGVGEYEADTDMGECETCSGTGRVPDVEATLRAEVARLTKALDVCNDVHGHNVKLKAANALLTAEVERLKGREREAASLVRELRGVLRDYLTCQACDACTSRDARIDAWLAGCKP